MKAKDNMEAFNKLRDSVDVMEVNAQLNQLRAEKAEKENELLKAKMAEANQKYADSPALISDLNREQYTQEIQSL